MRKTALFSAATAALACGPGSALAEITISAARITEGRLWVIGEADEPNSRITLDGAHETPTDRNGRFEFRVIYHPATCVVTLKTPMEAEQAVVTGCGQAGPQGVAGASGPPGPAGPPGATSVVSASEQPARPGPAQPSASPPTIVAGRPDTTQSLPSPATAPPPVEPPKPRPAPVAAPPPAAPPAIPVAGEWLDEDGKAKINIQPCGPVVCGAVSWSREGGGVGAQVLKSFKPAGPNSWKGTIINPESGKSYDSTITLLANNTLKVEGCVMGFLCGGQTWTRPTR